MVSPAARGPGRPHQSDSAALMVGFRRGGNVRHEAGWCLVLSFVAGNSPADLVVWPTGLGFHLLGRGWRGSPSGRSMTNKVRRGER
jgi:hypothetical protein